MFYDFGTFQKFSKMKNRYVRLCELKVNGLLWVQEAVYFILNTDVMFRGRYFACIFDSIFSMDCCRVLSSPSCSLMMRQACNTVE